MTISLMDHLREQGYEPYPAADGTWHDLTVSGTGTVRACLYDRHGRLGAEVHAFDAHMVNEWSARFTPGTPEPVILAAIEAAEWLLADKRGGPVTPAQAKNA